MRPLKVGMLSVGLVLVVGMLGCGQKPSPVAKEPKRRLTEAEAARAAVIAKIEELGGLCLCDEVSSLCDEESPEKPIVVVGLTERLVTDADLELLEGLTHLKRLHLSRNPEVTDAGLKHLEGLDSLERLDLHSTGLSDVGLEHLKGLTNLRMLRLDDSQISSSGLKHLEGLTNLVILCLDDTQVTGPGLEHHKGLTKLEELHLARTQVSDSISAVVLPLALLQPVPHICLPHMLLRQLVSISQKEAVTVP